MNTLKRFRLHCNFHDRSFVKKLGARWDANAKTWWVTDAVYKAHEQQLQPWKPEPWDGKPFKKIIKASAWKCPTPIFYQVIETPRSHRYDRQGECQIMGSSAELLFSRVAVGNGWTCTKTGTDADMHKHQDFILSKESSFTVDVKAMKRISRSDAQANEEWVWLELHGVREHDAGWLMGTHGADWIAFEQKTSFLIFDRRKLASWITTQYDPTAPAVTRAKDAKYRKYERRKQHKQRGFDVIMLASIKHMLMTDAFIAKWQK